MAALRTIVFSIVFYGMTVFYVTAARIAALFGKRPMRVVIHSWVRMLDACARHILGIHYRIEGEIPDGQFLFAAKHQAMYETMEFLNILETAAPVLKKELAEIPGWGWLTTAYGGIAVDRAGGAAAMRAMLKQTRDLLAQGRSVVIFPEGTRVLPGQTPPLQSGFAGLYKMLKLPVVAIALDSGKVWPRRSWIKRPGIITFRFFEPIPPGLPRAEIEDEVHKRINALEGVGEDLV